MGENWEKGIMLFLELGITEEKSTFNWYIKA
jgi:hypothetical protein